LEGLDLVAADLGGLGAENDQFEVGVHEDAEEFGFDDDGDGLAGVGLADLDVFGHYRATTDVQRLSLLLQGLRPPASPSGREGWE
jgi:hypothetical protein